MVEVQLQLHSWSANRRVVIVRPRIYVAIERERREDGNQLRLDPAGASVHAGDRLWEHAVLVTDAAYALEPIGQLYRVAADAEHDFDELKNPWGGAPDTNIPEDCWCLARGWASGAARPARLGGFTAQHINHCQTVGRACALAYTWWSRYCRAEHPTSRLEATTGRPLFLAAVGKTDGHANQTTLDSTPMHGRADMLLRLIANYGNALQHVKAAAEQLKDIDEWGCLLRYISDRIAPVIGPPKPPQGLPAT